MAAYDQHSGPLAVPESERAAYVCHRQALVYSPAMRHRQYFISSSNAPWIAPMACRIFLAIGALPNGYQLLPKPPLQSTQGTLEDGGIRANGIVLCFRSPPTILVLEIAVKDG